MWSAKREPAIAVASIPALIERWRLHCMAAARVAQAERGRFALAVPGGSVARAFLPALIEADIAWDRLDLFFCDERCVSADDPESNFALAEELLLAPLGERGPRVHRMAGDDPEPERAAHDYGRAMRFVLGSPPVLDLALLGLGEDGHVASLFPGRPALEALDPSVLVEPDAPKPPRTRLTLSLEVLAAAREVIVAAFGHAKAGAVAYALHDPTSASPLARLLHRARAATLMLDEEAASVIARP